MSQAAPETRERTPLRTGYPGSRSQQRAGLARIGSLALLLTLLVSGCGPRPAPDAPTAPASATPTSTPAPTPTPTPLPPIPMTIRWPTAVTALHETRVWVELPGLGERDPAARVWARVIDSANVVRWQSDLEQREGDVYTARVPLQIPLQPERVEWWLVIFVGTRTPLDGQRAVRFTLEPVPLRDLHGRVRPGVVLHVPQAFATTQQEGDEVAGFTVWRRANDQVELWWVPGPAEALTLDTAQTMLAATLPSDQTVEVLAVEPLEWAGLTGFHITERWEEGPAQSMVVQAPDQWLILLRLRSLNGEDVSPLLRGIQATFRVEG